MIYFKRMNETHITVTESGAVITSLPDSAFFADPVSGSMRADAPFYYKEISGDFVLAAKVELDFPVEGSEAFLLIMDNERLWVKAGVRYFDKKGYVTVSSITDICSDIAYGSAVNSDCLWIKLMRNGDVFSIYSSTAGKDFDLLRQGKCLLKESVKVGIGTEAFQKETEGRVNFARVLFGQEVARMADLDSLSDFFG